MSMDRLKAGFSNIDELKTRISEAKSERELDELLNEAKKLGSTTGWLFTLTILIKTIDFRLNDLDKRVRVLEKKE